MGFISVIRKELLEISHDRTMMAVLVLFPVLIMVFMGSSFGSMQINGVPVGVSGPANSTFSAMVLQGLENSTAFKLQTFETSEEALAAFRDGQIRALIIIPQNIDEELKRGNGTTIRLIVDNSDIALEKSILAAMGSVLQASSADITKVYVTSAWDDLVSLNTSASDLGAGVAQTRVNMEATKRELQGIKQNISALDIEGLASSIDDAESGVSSLQGMIALQKAQIANYSAENSLFFAQSDAFLQNGSATIEESIAAVNGAHANLSSQVVQLGNTANELQYSIDGLNGLKATASGTCGAVTVGAIDVTVAGLEALKNNTLSQKQDAEEQLVALEGLNTTLYGMKGSLANYSAQMDAARQKQAEKTSDIESSLDNAYATLSDMQESFAKARKDVDDLKALLAKVQDTMDNMDDTLDEALAQTASVDSLISSLQATVAEQTSKDPSKIAVPLSVNIENSYTRKSFVDFIMPQVISVSLLLSCFLLASISFVREKTRKTIVRALLAPGSMRSLVIGKIASIVLISFAQVFIILLVGTLLFGVGLPLNLEMLFFGVFVSSLVLASIGMLVGFYTKTESAAIQGCLLLAVPMMFLGNIIFSADLLPQYTQILQALLPLAHVTNIFRVVLITNGNPSIDIIALLTYFVLLVVLLTVTMIRKKDIGSYS